MASIKASTQSHLDILDIKRNTILLKNSSAAYVLETSAINFDLLSMMEQNAAISAYSNLINSLSFPIQVTIRTNRMDISSYLDKIKTAEDKEQNPKIKEQIRLYRKFILEDLITKEEVLDKKFYVTIPFGNFKLSKTNPFGSLFGFFLAPTDDSKINVDSILKGAIEDLEPKKDFLMKEFSRIGVKAKHLTTQDLIKLFYDIYNSEITLHQKIKTDMVDFTAALVEPKIF